LDFPCFSLPASCPTMYHVRLCMQPQISSQKKAAHLLDSQSRAAYALPEPGDSAGDSWLFSRETRFWDTSISQVSQKRASPSDAKASRQRRLPPDRHGLRDSPKCVVSHKRVGESTAPTWRTEAATHFWAGTEAAAVCVYMCMPVRIQKLNRWCPGPKVSHVVVSTRNDCD